MKKIMIYIMILALICTRLPMEVVASQNISAERVESIYVDGIKYDIEVDTIKGDLIVSGETSVSEGTMILTNHGDATINIENEKQANESYDIEIDELSKENVDIEVYDDNGNLTEYYDEYEEIVQETYEGQTAVSVSLVISAAVLLYITTYYVIVKSGVTYCIADAFTKAIANAKATVRDKARGYYYPAILKTVNKRTYVYINPKGINVNKAAILVKSGASVYSYTAKMARKVLTKAGYVPCSSKGVKNQAERHSSAGYQFYHYHAGHTNSSGALAKTGSIHSLYGSPKLYN